ncbi:hypothetical protein AMS68_001696 [Peltaster fructicola]|uniref:Sm domain-containing protein n=1 Tax=Peltaster fructicola TaxID=286661 RepID=A0A6H0XNH5_9PEZI|nr:hypothetical protein AMS68_001696 [Peltaster fructicola]
MSERGQFRGGRGGNRGDKRGGRGDHAGRGGHAQGAAEKKKENILDLTKYMDKEITVKFSVIGSLKGYDQLMNLVLDNVREITRDEEGNTSTRSLGLLVARGTLLVLISPMDGSEEIANPFVQADDDE